MSSSMTRAARHELAPFFGNDGRADLFIKLFWKNMDAPINTTATKIYENELSSALSFMRAKEYTSQSQSQAKNETGYDMNDDDVHYDFTDFIINTALFHRALDQPTGVGMFTKTNIDPSVDTVGNDKEPAVVGDVPVFGLNEAVTHISMDTTGIPTAAVLNGTAAGRIATVMGGVTFDRNLVIVYDAFTRVVILIAGQRLTKNATGTALPGTAQTEAELANIIDRIVPIMADQLWNQMVPLLNMANITDATVQATIEREFKTKLIYEVSSHLKDPNIIKYDETKIAASMDDVSAKFTNYMHDTVYRVINDVINKIVPHRISAVSSSGAADKAQEIMWNNVVAKWSELSLDSKNYYDDHITVMRVADNTKVDIDKLSGADMRQYRINLKKTNIGKECPKFQQVIPFIDITHTNFVWYTNASNKIQRTTGAINAVTLRNLYCEVYRGMPTAGFINLPLTWVSKSDVIFRVHVSKIIQKMILRIKKVAAMEEIPEEESVINLLDRNVWQRVNDPSAESKIKFILVKDGKTIEYGENNAEYQQLVNSGKGCFSTLVNATGEDCEQYMYKCLLTSDSQGVENCLEYWKKTSDFFTAAKEEITKMHPMVAVKTLQRFGFQMEEVYDSEAGRRLKKVECVSKWVNRIAGTNAFDVNTTTKTSDVLKIIKDNADLMNYLKLVREYINANPAILNAGYSGATVESKGIPETSDYLKKLNIGMRRNPMGYGDKATLDQKRMYDKIRVDYSGLSRSRPGMPMSTGLPTWSSYFGTRDVGFGIPFQIGGHNSFLKRQAQGKITGAVALGNIIDGLVANLRRSGKTIDENTEKMLKEKKKQLYDVEKNLLETEMYLEEYKNIIDMFQQYDQQVITMNDIKKMVDHHHRASTKLYNGEKYLVDVFGALTQLLDDKKGVRHEELNV